MQINRLFEIVYLLLDEKQYTAKELAEHFEVSTRTIYRDIETLSGAGIPVYMMQGKGGGIALLPHFILNKAVLTKEDKKEIITALESLRAVNASQNDQTLQKLKALLCQNESSWIDIDFGDWGNLLKEQFEISKKAILERRLLDFDYVSSQGARTHRTVEPARLLFKDHTWYLKCFCLEKQEPRLFRLSRMRQVVCLDTVFAPRNLSFPVINEVSKMNETEILVRIDGIQCYRIYDEFLDKDVSAQENGSFLVRMKMIEDEWLYGYLLSFGDSLEVIKPEHVKAEMKKRVLKMLDKYDV